MDGLITEMQDNQNSRKANNAFENVEKFKHMETTVTKSKLHS
jgi:hypothetical protein